MTVKKMMPSELARATGISEPTISRWLNDKQNAVRPDALEKLCTALGQTKREQAGLIRARLLDECYGPGSDLIHITVGREEVGMRITETGVPPLPPKIEAAFKTLRDNFEDPDLQQILIGLAAWFEKQIPSGGTPPVSSARAEDVALLPAQVLALSDEAAPPNAGKSAPSATAPGARESKVDYRKRRPSRK